MNIRVLLSTLALSVLLITACGNQQNSADLKPDASADKAHKEDDCSRVHWSHHAGKDGPENWKNLCDGFSDCGGQAQSPIDIKSDALKSPAGLQAIAVNYGASPVDIINNGHTVRFNISGEHSAMLGGKKYTLLQFHYHALSEHTIDGKYYPLEVHFVHKHSDTDFAVIGVMFEEGAENPLFSKYLDHFPQSRGEYSTEETFEPASMLPSGMGYYHYQGSLTTPPCSEVVSWYVLKTPVTASAKQLKAFAAILDNNYRPVQPLNGRDVVVFNP